MNIFKFIINSHIAANDFQTGNIAVSVIGILGIIFSIVFIGGSFIFFELNPYMFRIITFTLLLAAVPLIWYYFKLKEHNEHNN